VEGETCSCSQTVVTCDFVGTEEVSIKEEESIDIKDEIPEAVSFPSVKTELEVRPFMASKKETVNLHFTISCFVLYVGVMYLMKFGMKS
jgi:hypothetical protein